MNNIIKIDNLSYNNLFNSINLDIERYKYTMIASSNNSGKTTLIKMLNRTIKTNNIYLEDLNINNYQLESFNKSVQTIYPLEYLFLQKNLIDELNYYCNNKELLEFIIKGLKIRRILTKNIKLFTKKEFILAQLAISLSKEPLILLLDCPSYYFTDPEWKNIMVFLKNYQSKHDLTIIETTLSLNNSLLIDKLIIINKGEIILEGEPLTVLKKDNIINKSGLELPFMLDLSVKLIDYNLLEEIELDKDRMLDLLWK